MSEGSGFLLFIMSEGSGFLLSQDGFRYIRGLLTLPLNIIVTCSYL